MYNNRRTRPCGEVRTNREILKTLLKTILLVIMKAILKTSHYALLKTKRYKGPSNTLKLGLWSLFETIYSTTKITNMT